MSEKYDILFVGPGCIDTNIDMTGEKVHGAGGAAWFASFAARAAGAKVFAAVSMNPADRILTDAFEDIPMKIFPADRSTAMQNTYFDATREKRESIVVSQAPPYRFEALPDGEFRLCHLAGLLYGDFPEELIEKLHKRFPLSADMQGFLRHNENGSLVFHDWSLKKRFLPYFRFLKADANEAEIMTGTSDRRKAAELLHAWGAEEVLISHNEEMLVFDGANFETCPVRARNLSGRTGRGDSIFGSYLARRMGGDAIPEALLYATALVSLKMEKPGPFSGTDADVRAFIKEFYS